MKLKIILALVATAATLAWKAEAQTYDTNNVLVQSFAGSGFSGYYDGQGTQTMFNNPSSVVADTSGNLFVMDIGNGRIRKIMPDGAVSTFAGNGADPAIPLPPGYGTNVSLGRIPYFGAMAIDSLNSLWIVANSGSYDLKQVKSDGYVSFVSPTNLSSFGTSLHSLGVWTNSGLCVDSRNNLYFSTFPWNQSVSGNRIYRYTTNGALEVFAGSGNQGAADGNWIFTSFYNPTALAADAADNIYVWDAGNRVIRRINQNRDVVTVAGRNGVSTNSDGVGTNATFNSISGMCVDDSGNVILVCGSSIRKMSATTNVTTLAGSFSQLGYTNGPGNLARFSGANGVCLSQGSIFVADSSNHRIRQINFNPQPQVVSGANLGIGTYAGLSITGVVGRTYQIQSSPDMNTWSTVAVVLLTSNPYLWIDQNPVSGNKLYRAILLP